MASKTAGRRKGESREPQTVKVTLRLPVETAQRLGVEAVMRRTTQSAVVEEVLGPYLRRWRLPSTVEEPAPKAGPVASGRAEDAA